MPTGSSVSGRQALRLVRRLAEPTSDNNVVGASARFARSGVHGAYGVRARERAGGGWGGTWPRTCRAGAASPTSERYPKALC